MKYGLERRSAILSMRTALSKSWLKYLAVLTALISERPFWNTSVWRQMISARLISLSGISVTLKTARSFTISFITYIEIMPKTCRQGDENFCISTKELNRILLSWVEMNFDDYLNYVRINRASELLLKTDKILFTIAVEVGYNTKKYWTGTLFASAPWYWRTSRNSPGCKYKILMS